MGGLNLNLNLYLVWLRHRLPAPRQYSFTASTGMQSFTSCLKHALSTSSKLLAHLLLELSAQLGFLADSYESGGCVPIRDPRDNVAVQYCVLQLLLGKFCCITGGVLKKRAPADLEI